jgi:hypothetical protein
MHEREHRLGDLTAFEAALASLTPRVDPFQRERLFFLAGQASVATSQGPRRSRWTPWGWPAAFSAMTATAGCLLVMLCTRTAPNGAVPAAANAAVQTVPTGPRPSVQAKAMVPAVARGEEAVETPACRWPPAAEEAVDGRFDDIAHVLAARLPPWPAAQPPAGRMPWSRELAYAAADCAPLRPMPWQKSQRQLPGASGAAPTTTAPEEPRPHRELLERLLREQASTAWPPHARSRIISEANL